MYKFKVGDRVRVLVDEPECAQLLRGDVVEVLRLLKNSDRDDDNYIVSGKWWVHGKYLELESPENTIIHNDATYDLRELQPVEWKWGMWAVYAGKLVFVMNAPDGDRDVPVSHPDFMNGFAYVPATQLTPIAD